MGDRGNIIIEQDNDHFKAPLFFYTHWSGSQIKETLQNALKRGQGRWTDPSYLARIIFSEMIQDSIMEETGFGISNMPCDNEHDYLLVHIPKKRVRLVKYDYTDRGNPLTGKVLQEWSFTDYILPENSFSEAEDEEEANA